MDHETPWLQTLDAEAHHAWPAEFESPFQLSPVTQDMELEQLDHAAFDPSPSLLEPSLLEEPRQEQERTCPGGCGHAACPPGTKLPVLYRGMASRSTAVEYAQRLLNRFLAATASGFSTCIDCAPPRLGYMQNLRDQLRRTGQEALRVDGWYGPETELATRLFQTCRGLMRDGKIGPVTWQHLTRYDTGEAPAPQGEDPAMVGVLHQCRPGEGPPAAADPTGSTPRPLVFQSTSADRSRNPTVGHAQQLLNRFLGMVRSGMAPCREPATMQYIVVLHNQLRANRQDPLVVDCRFGPSTELATKMFQACHGLVRDGKIGPITWPLLERLAQSPVPVPPAPIPPEPVPPTPSSVRERRDVWTLTAADRWHPVILWYARGVVELKRRDRPPFADPTCWQHLAEVHGTDIPRARWPAGALWDACEHGSWHFLPWHRVYLHHFEKIMRAAIVSLGGPPDWALPYWDYSRPDVARLPPAFRERTLPGGGDNPLFIEQRGPGINDGAPLHPDVVNDSGALGQTIFTPAFGGGFGGSVSPPGTHRGGGVGQLEGTPHGDVHVAVGGTQPRGFMSRFETAGRDPVFWLHHANIDRLWELWLRQPGRANPVDPRWLGARFNFGSGAATTSLTTAEILDPRRAPLEYRYSDMPLVPTREGFDEAFVAPFEPLAPWMEAEEPRPVELVGATGAPVPLGSGATVAHVAVSPPAGPLGREVGEGGAPPAGSRVFLRLENITGSRLGAGTFNVHVNLPEGHGPRTFPTAKPGSSRCSASWRPRRRRTSTAGAASTGPSTSPASSGRSPPRAPGTRKRFVSRSRPYPTPSATSPRVTSRSVG